MKCKNCGAELMEGIVFCPECGEKNEISEQSEVKADPVSADPEPDTEKTINLGNDYPVNDYQADNIQPQAAAQTPKKYCPQCGTENAADAVFCGNCGFAFSGNGSGATPEKKKSKSGLKKVLIAAAAVAGVAVLGVGAYTILGSLGSKDVSFKLLYAKDNELSIMVGNKPITIEGDLTDDSYENISIGNSYFPVTFSEDGKYLFYPQDYTGSGYDLYRRKANSKNDKGDKFASGVTQYQLIDNDRFAYLNSSSKLWISDKDDKQKVDSDVRTFKVSDDKKKIFWIKSNGDMYVRDIKLKKDETELDTDVSGAYYVSDDLKTIIYSSDNNLYLISNFGEEEKIASDVTDVKTYVDDNDKLTLYYTKDGDSDTDLRMSDVIIDDMAASDALIYEPNISDYQKTEIKDSFWGPIESTETDYDAYYAECEKYEQKLTRDSVRTSLNQTIDLDYKEIYYYDVKANKSELVLSAPMLDYYNNSSEGIAVFGYYDIEETAKVNLSQLSEEEYYQLEDIVYKRLADTEKVCAVKKTEKVDLDIDVSEYSGFGYIRACADTDMIYLKYTAEDNVNNTLLSTNLGNDKGKMTELSDELYNIELVNDKGVYYTTAVDNDGVGELYLNDKSIVDDVVPGSVQQFGNNLIYSGEKSNQEYTLMLYKSGKQKQIADDVADHYILDDDRIAFLDDYNFNKYRGDLKLYDDGNIKDIDTDVAAILKY